MPLVTSAKSLDTALGTADLAVLSDWGGGFTGQITITNAGAVATDGWEVVITTADHLTGSWNSNLVSAGNGQYILSAASWNAALAAGGSTTLGFNMDQASDTAPISVALVQIGSSTLTTTPAPSTPTPVTTTPPATSTPATTTQGASAVLSVTNDWGSGFTGQVTVTNTGTSAITGWQVEMDTLGHLTGEWNSTLVSQGSGDYILSNDANDGTLAAGASTTFGFNMDRASNTAITVGVSKVTGAAGTTTPTATTPPTTTPAPTTPTAPVTTPTSGTTSTGTTAAAGGTATLAVTNDWGSGFTGQITVTNTGTTAISGWQVAIASQGHLTGNWNSTLLSQAAGSTILSNTSANGTLAAGASTTFGFNMDRAAGSSAISVALTQVTGGTVAPTGTTPTPVPITPVTPTAPSNPIVLGVSEDAYAGDAQFTVAVDGVQTGTTYTATASHANGQSGLVTLAGSYGSGPHTVTVDFINDAYGGPGLDRNLYLDSVTYGGATQAVGTGLYTENALATVTVGGTATPTPPVTTPPTPPTTTTSTGTFQYLGVNLSGAEFGIPDPTDGNTNIGTYGSDYTYPTHAEVDYYASEGLNVIRLPFSWERLEPTMNGPLDQTQLGYIDDVVQYAATKGMTVLLDPHNYGYGYGSLIGSTATPDSAYAKFWSLLAQHYEAQSNVMFGLMNEPHVQSAQDWVAPTNDAIAAIRATGATQEITVPGTDWTGGDSWITSGNAGIFASQVVDPLHNMAFEIHQYSDSDGSGSSTSVVSTTIGEQRLQAVTQWAEQTGNKLFLGEFGAGQDAASIANLTSMLSYMQQHTDAWQGGTEWGGGPWWGNYGFALDPQNGVTTPQVATLASFAPNHTVA